MFANDDFHVDTDFTGPTENFDHATHRSQAGAGITRDFDVDHGAIELWQPQPALRDRPCFGIGADLLPQFGRQLVAGRNCDFVLQPRVVRQHHVAVRTVAEKPDDRGVLALDDLDYAPFGAAVRAAALHARQDVIAVHRIAQPIASDKKIAIHAWDRAIRHQEAVAIAVGDDSAGDQIRIASASRLRRC